MIKKTLLTIALFTAAQLSVNAQLVSTLVNLNQGTMGDGITVAKTGDIYYSSGFGTSFNKVFKITPEGEFSVFKDITNPVGIISDSLLNLYTNTYQGNSVRKIDSLGNVSVIATGLNGPAGIVLNQEGELFVSEYGANFSGTGNRIVKVNPDSTFETFVSSTSFSGLIGLTIDESGNLYTSNWGNGRVFKITPEKEISLLADLPGNVNQISYSNGYVLAPVPTLNRIYRIDIESGSAEILAGNGSTGNKDGIALFAEFSRPNGIAPSATGDTLYFNDGGIVKMITGLNLPRIEIGGEFENEKINIEVDASKAYDSLQVLIDEEVVETFYSVTEADSVFNFNYKPEQTKVVDIYVLGFSGLQATISSKLELTVLNFDDPIEGYRTDFDERPTADFLVDGFSISRTLLDWTDYRAYTTRDYRENSEYGLILLKPIQVNSDSSILIYSDVAIVEPGEEESVFGTEEFKDYVVVEGNKGDGWVPLSDGYDARYDEAWLNTWPENGDVEELFRSHKVDLLDTFDAGDTVLVRFRLFSDEDIVGYGWVISEIEIQANLLTSIDYGDDAPLAFVLEQNYPNPFNPSTSIEFTIPTYSHVKLSVFNIAGKEVAVLVDEGLNPGKYLESFSAELLSSGVYFYRLQSEGGFSRTNKMLLIK